MARCQRCNRPDSATRYRVAKPGLTHERDLCEACAKLTAAVFGLEPIEAAVSEALAESPEEEAPPAEAPPDENESGEAPAAPETAEEEPKPARKPRRTRWRKS